MVAFGGIRDEGLVVVEGAGWSVKFEAVGVDCAALKRLESFSTAPELPKVNQITFLLKRICDFTKNPYCSKYLEDFISAIIAIKICIIFFFPEILKTKLVNTSKVATEMNSS